MKNIFAKILTAFSLLAILASPFAGISIAELQPKVAHALYSMSCNDGATDCSPYTSPVSYNMGLAGCDLSGPDLTGGNRILGGETCGIGSASDDGGYYMNGNGTPDGSTQTFHFGSPTPPGWTYSKTQFSSNTIPSGTFSYDAFDDAQFYSGQANVTLYPPDDNSTFTVGSNTVSYTSCPGRVIDVTISGCPSTVKTGTDGTINVNSGDPISLSITNQLRPNNGSARWGTGSANIVLVQVTICRTQAYFAHAVSIGALDSTNLGRGYEPDPTVAGQCDSIGAHCTINSFSCTQSASAPYIDTMTWSTSNCQNVNISPAAPGQSGTSVSNSGTDANISASTNYGYNSQQYSLTTLDGQTQAAVCRAVPQPSLQTTTSNNVINLTAGQNTANVNLNLSNTGSSNSVVHVGVTCATPEVTSGSLSASNISGNCTSADIKGSGPP